MGTRCHRSSRQSPATKPNIVYILADDLATAICSATTRGQKIPRRISTACGRRHEVHRCARSGRRVHTTALWSAHGPLQFSFAAEVRRARAVDDTLIEEGRMTVPALLREHGYATACIGKWHLGRHWPTRMVNRPRAGTASAMWISPNDCWRPDHARLRHILRVDVPNYPLTASSR